MKWIESHARIRILFFLRELGKLEDKELLERLIEVYVGIYNQGSPFNVAELDATLAVICTLAEEHGQEIMDEIYKKFKDSFGDGTFDEFIEEMNVENWEIEV